MKKGLSLLLSLLLVISAISCLGVVASAYSTVYADQWYTVADESTCLFTAPVTGLYAFHSSGENDPRIDLYDYDTGDYLGSNDDFDGYDFLLEVDLYEGQIVELHLSDYDGGSDINFHISYEEYEEEVYPSVELGVWYCAESGTSYYFTAPADGYYEFKSSGNGDPKITLYDYYGDSINSFDDNIGLDFHGTTYLYAGQTIELYIHNYEGTESNFVVNKAKGIVSAQFVGPAVCYEENVSGHWETDENNNRFFYYDVHSYDFKVNGSYIYVTYDTGETDSFIFDPVLEDYVNIKGEALGYDGYSSNQYENHWYKGANNYLTIYFSLFECNVPVYIVDNSSSKNVQSISYSFGSVPLYLIYGVDGYYEYDEITDTDFFYYAGFSIAQPGSSLVVGYTDGTSETYTLVKDKGFVTANNKELPMDINYYTNQYDVHWGIGTNYVTIEYGGAICQLPVQVIENPYSSVEFHYGDNTLYENAEDYDGYWSYDDNDNRYFRYYTDVYSEGNYIKVYYKTGGYSIFYYDEDFGGFLDQYGNLYLHRLNTETTQYDNHWYLNGTYPVYFTIAGLNATAYLTVVENPVASFVLNPVYSLTYYEGSNCWVDYDDNGQSYYYYETPYSFELLYRDGTTFTVYYKNGTNTVYRYSDRTESFIDANGNEFEGSISWYTNQADNHWYVGQNIINVDYMGVKGSVPVQILPASQTPGRWLTYNAEYDEWICMLGAYMDQTYEGLVYHNGALYYADGGTIDWDFTGLVAYGSDFYYVSNGMLDWNYTGLAKYEGGWYFVINGMINWGATGLVNAYNQWYYVENGYLNPYRDTLACHGGVWYGVDDGKINWVGSRLVEYNGGWYYVENGAVNWGYSGLAQYGENWYYVSNGCIDWNATGLVYYNGNYYYVENGYLNWNSNTLVLYNDGWYYVYNGSVAWWYTGLVYYNGEYYYVENGYLNWNCNTLTQYNNGWYYVYGGSVAWDYTSLVYFEGTYYYIENGFLNWNCDTLVQYNGEWYYVYGGTVAWDYTGYVNYNGVNYYITNGYLNWANN